MAAGLDFMINIQQKLGGDNAVNKLAELESKLKAETKALAELEAMMKRLQKQDSVSVEDYQKLQGQIDEKKASIQGLTSELINMRGTTDATGGSVEGLGAKLQAFKAGPAMAAAAAIYAVVAALVVITVKVAAFVASVADAHRSMLIMLEGATGTAAGASAAAGAIDRVAGKSAVAREELTRMAQSLAMAGISGKMLETTLQQLANVHSVLGATASSTYETVTKGVRNAFGKLTFQVTRDQLRELGLTMEDLGSKFGMSAKQIEQQMLFGKVSVEKGVDAMNDLLQNKFGKLAERKALSLAVQLMRLRENLSGLFRDVDVEAFLKAIKEVLSVFDAQTASGKALKLMLTETFSALFNWAAKAGPYVKAFFQGMIIMGLMAYVAFKRVTKALSDMFGGGDVISKATMLKVALYGGMVAAALLGVAIFVVVAALAILGSMAAVLAVLVALPFLIPLAAIGLLIYGIYSIVGAFSGLGAGASEAGGNVVDGFIGGITGGIGRAIAAVRGLGQGAMGALKGILGIASPSKEFSKLGGFTAEGFAEGVTDGAPEAHGAMAKMAEMPEPSSGGRGAGKGGRGGGITIHSLTLHGVDAEDLWEQFKARLTTEFDKADLMGPEPEVT